MKPVGQTPKPTVSRTALVALCLLLPALLGGCPEFRNAAVGAVDGATHTILLSDTEPRDAVETARDAILGAALDLFFAPLRSDETS